MTPAQRILAQIMSNISEERTCAGWINNLEYALWARLVNDTAIVGESWQLTNQETEELTWLAGEANGWIVWNDNAKDERFVSINEWKALYQAWREETLEAKQQQEAKQATCNHQWCRPLNLACLDEHCEACYIDRKEYEGRHIKPLEPHELHFVDQAKDKE